MNVRPEHPHASTLTHRPSQPHCSSLLDAVSASCSQSCRRLSSDFVCCQFVPLCVTAALTGMHLLTFLKMKQPGPVFRGMVWLSQGIFTNFFFAAYIVSPKFCHRVTAHRTLSHTCTMGDHHYWEQICLMLT